MSIDHAKRLKTLRSIAKTGCGVAAGPGEYCCRGQFCSGCERLIELLEIMDATPAPESPAPTPVDDEAKAALKEIIAIVGLKKGARWADLVAAVRAMAPAPEVGTGSETSPDAGASREALAEHLYMATGRVVPWARCERQAYWRDRADKVLALLGSAALSAGLTWTKEKPKVDGRYWYRVAGENKQSIDLVRMFTGAPCWNSTERRAWVPVSDDLEWAGPVPESGARSLAKPAEASDAEQIPHPVAEAEQSRLVMLEALFRTAFYAGAESQGWSDGDQAGCDIHTGNACAEAWEKARAALAQVPTRTQGKGPQ